MSLAAEPRAPFLSQDGPWRPRDLGRVLVVAGLGAVGLGVGWYGASGQVTMRDEVVWIAVSTTAAAVAGMALTTWLTTGMRTVRSEHRALQDHLVADLSDAPTNTDQSDGTHVTADGMRFFHRPSCPFVIGKAARAMDGKGLSPCSWCRP